MIAAERRTSDRRAVERRLYVLPALNDVTASSDRYQPSPWVAGLTILDRSRWPACCAPSSCRCDCGCQAHSHYARCRPCAFGEHDPARGFLDAEPSPSRLGHLLPDHPRRVH